MGQVSTLTIGSTTYSVYGLTADPIADAKAYFAGRLGTAAWDDADSGTRKAALVTAVRFLDRGVLWSGVQTDAATPQPLQWPRDSATCNGDAVTDGTTPDRIVNGEFELALALLEDESIQDSQGTGSNIKKVGAGTASVEFFRPTQGTTSETRFPTTVHELVGCYQDNAGTLGAPFASGVNKPANPDQTSSFDSCDDSYDLTQGYS